MTKQTRRDFLKTTAKATAGALLGADSAEKLLANMPAATALGDGEGKKGGASLSLPKGGGAIKGIGEKFSPNPFTGTGNFSVPIAVSPGRGGMQPALNLQYSTGQGNSPFGLGWSLDVPFISRKTDKGIPLYDDDKDVFLLHGSEDLVPYLQEKNGEWQKYGYSDVEKKIFEDIGYKVTRYRPRTEGSYLRIEFWKGLHKDSSFWVVTSKDNTCTIYGLNEATQLFFRERKSDGTFGQKKIFQWMPEFSFQPTGNYIYFQYRKDKAEDVLNKASIYEAHRKADIEYQIYISRIHYANRDTVSIPYHHLNGTLLWFIQRTPQDPSIEDHFLFTVLFDYGLPPIAPNNNINEAIYSDIKNQNWVARADPFSSYKSGFEIRTYRLCKRVMMFHRDPNDRYKTRLVRSTDLHYEPNDYNGMSMLTKVIQRGYRYVNDGQQHQSEELHLNLEGGVKSSVYAIKSLPPLEFNYSEFKPKKQNFKPITADNRDLTGDPLSNPNMALVDLHGTGLNDLLLTSALGYFYWTNKGEGHFSSRRTMKQMPNNVQLNGAGVSFGDMAGDGQLDLLVHEGNQWGFYENNSNAGWQKFTPYKKQPSFDINDAHSRLMDLTGDGKTDLLRIDENYFYYFPCIGEEGWDSPKRVKRTHDLAEFPDVDFSNPRVKLADMTGDGLQDIVLVHDGRIDYWANMGYGKFSRRITLKNAPRFGYGFDPKRLLFADIDGSGTADMIYLEGSRVRVWFNQSGNIWSEEVEINGTPSVTDTDTMQVADMYGCGCQGLLWSSVYRGNTESNYRFMDFTGGVKPNLLTEVNDNMGVTTKVSYKPSTHFYLEDKKRGREWATALPFPVQCLEKVEHIDHISNTKLVTRYAYHHGYYDGREREFRGFAFVEQWDTEGFNGDFSNNDKGYHVPPVLTKMWFHTGAYPNEKVREAYSKWSSGAANFDMHELFKKDYYNKGKDILEISNAIFEGYNGKLHQKGVFEAYRALRGQMLRQEIYAIDGSDKEKIPYTVATTSAKVKMVQPKAENEFAVFRADAYESISYHYERKADNPRISQDLTLLVDDYGNIEQSLSIVYPSKNTTEDGQRKILTTFTKNQYKNWAGTDNNYGTHFNRIGVLCEKQVFEVHGLAIKIGFDWTTNPIKVRHADIENYKLSELSTKNPKHAHQANEISNTDFVLRRLAWERHYFKDYFSGIQVDKEPLKERNFLGCHEFLNLDLVGLPYESYQASFHQSQIKDVFGTEVTDDMLTNAGYIKTLPKSEGDPPVRDGGYWWIPSGQQSIIDNTFWQPQFTIDPFGNKTIIEYEGRECLLMKSLTDALNNKIEVIKNDYFTLQPSELMDANGVRSKVMFDAMGAVVATGIMGKNKEGDTLDTFKVPYEYDDAFRNYMQDNKADDLLQDTSSVMLYDLWRGLFSKGNDKYVTKPQAVYSIAREEHHSINKTPVIQRKISYFDGLDRELQTKLSFEPESTGKKWLTSGWKIYNNKGKPVRQYEPFFSPSFDYQLDEEKGVSSVLFYDPLDRAVCTIHPNGTYEKVVFDAWQQMTYDVNDTLGVYDDVGNFISYIPKNDPEIKGFVKNFNEPYEAWLTKNTQVAEQVKKLAQTPTTTFLDTLGRPFKTVQIHTINNIDNDRQEFFTINELDIQGNILSITDPRGVKCFEHQFDMLKRQLVVESKDAGKKILLTDVAGQPIWTKDALGNITLSKYDALRRPTELWVKEGSNTEGGYFLAQKTIYGEAVDKPYFKGKVWKTYDGAGMAENVAFDFKGNVIQAQRQLSEKKKEQVKWSENETTNEGKLESKAYKSIFVFDALGRIISAILPDGKTVKTPQYNKSNLLKSLKVNGVEYVKSIEYNAKGQREKIKYGNDVTTTYEYEQETYRLTHLKSLRNNDDLIQDLSYVYDPVGNILSIADKSIDPIFNDNSKIDAVWTYQYDSLYRLIEATGREHENNNQNPETIKFMKAKGIPIPQPSSNKQAMVNYTEQYEYDKAGNFTKKTHIGATTWTVIQDYEPTSNRIRSSKQGINGNPIIHTHDANGNITSMYQKMEWNYANQLISVTKTVGADEPQAYYQYDAQGNRIVKTVGKTQRIYLGDYEVYTEGGNKTETIHIMDDKARIAVMDYKNNETLIRYNLTNHLGSSTLELNDKGGILTYEEYYPYGGTSFLGGKEDKYISLKRYRYSGKERDEETGLYYYGARYYAAWMGRWCSCDPIGNGDGNNIYLFVSANPIKLIDKNGLAGGQELQCKPQSENIATNSLETDKGEAREQIGRGGASGVITNTGTGGESGDSTAPKPSSDIEKFRTLQKSMSYQKDENQSSGRNFLIEQLEKINSENPSTYTRSVYKDVIPKSPAASNYHAAALYTADNPVNNQVRWTLQSNLLQYGIEYGYDSMVEKVQNSTNFSYDIHESAFQNVNKVATIRQLPWLILTEIDVPKLGSVIAKPFYYPKAFLSATPVFFLSGSEAANSVFDTVLSEADQFGGKVINWNIEKTNNPQGGNTMPWYGKGLRNGLDFLSSVTNFLYD